MSYPIIIPSGGHGQITPEGLKGLLGVWILVNLIWFMMLLYGFIPALKERKDRINNNNHYKHLLNPTNIFKCWWSEREYHWMSIIDILMLIFWGILALIYFGFEISKFI